VVSWHHGASIACVGSRLVPVELAVTTPAFLDLTFVGLEALPGPGEERYAGDLLRTPGGGAITAVAAARLGLSTALLAPLGTDMAGEFVAREVEAEGVEVAGFRTDRTPQTVVMPVGVEQSMVTVDTGVRARAADVARLQPLALAANLDQLDLLSGDMHAYLTCGDDDARAYARRPPAGLAGARAMFVTEPHALQLTGAGSVEAAAERLGAWVETVMVPMGDDGTLAMSHGQRVEVPRFDTGPVVDATGSRDLLCAAFAWADLRGAAPDERIAWAQLYAQLAMTVPTATRGALTEERLVEEGIARGLTRPAQP
jgi:sugar/nucleoside kinase (ribokinase family)